MKKFLLVLLIFSFVSVANAQEMKIMLGGSFSHYKIWPDLQFTNFYLDDYSYEISFKSGLLLGIGIEFSLSKRIAIEVDALYFQKGSKIQRVFPLLEMSHDTEDLNLDAFSILSLIKFRFFPGSSPYVFAGGELSHVYSDRESPSAWIIPYEEMDTFNIKRSFDYGLVFGAGFEMKEKIFTFFIEGRYHLGLGNIAKEPVDWESVKTRAFALIFGIKI